MYQEGLLDFFKKNKKNILIILGSIVLIGVLIIILLNVSKPDKHEPYEETLEEKRQRILRLAESYGKTKINILESEDIVITISKLIEQNYLEIDFISSECGSEYSNGLDEEINYNELGCVVNPEDNKSINNEVIVIGYDDDEVVARWGTKEDLIIEEIPEVEEEKPEEIPEEDLEEKPQVPEQKPEEKPQVPEQKPNAKKTITAKFELNGSGSVGSKTLSCTTSGSSCSIKTPSITRSGYTIVGWNTDKNATTAKYKVGENVSLSNNITLYAITKKVVTITFNKNSATSIGATSKTCILYNTNSGCNITSPGITRSGYTIVGWNTNSKATTSNWNVNTVKTVNTNATYYAITKKKLTVNYDGNGASLTLNGKTASTVQDTCYIYNAETECANRSWPTITRSGWTIIGFSANKNATTKDKSNWTSGASTVILDNENNKIYYAITKKTVSCTDTKKATSNTTKTPKSCVAAGCKTWTRWYDNTTGLTQAQCNNKLALDNMASIEWRCEAVGNTYTLKERECSVWNSDGAKCGYTEKTTYSCDSGYTLSGTTCSKSTSKTIYNKQSC